MYFKNGNRYITDDMQGLPIDELKIGDHFISFGKERKNKYTGQIHDMTYTTILSERIDNRLFTFEGQELYSNVDHVHGNEGDEFPEETFASPMHERIINNYIKLGENELFPINNFTNKTRDLQHSNPNSGINEVYKKVTEDLYFTLEFGKNKFLHDGGVIEFLPFEIESGVYLTFVTKNRINVTKRAWYKSYLVYLIYKNSKTIFELHCDFLNMYKRVGKHYDVKSSLRKQFEETIQMMQKDVLSEVESGRENILQSELNLYFYGHYSVDNITAPIYENKDLKLRVYPDEFENVYRRTPRIHIEGKGYLYSYEINDEYRNEYRKAKEILKFSHDNEGQTGVNPFDGKYYEKGKLREELTYRDYEGVIVRKGASVRMYAQEIHYVRLDDIYVEANNPGDDWVIKQMKEREKMLNEMMIE